MSEETAATARPSRPDYPTAQWRLLNTGFRDGATNMAMDEAILRGVAEKVAPPTLRFFGWQPACVSLGYAQPFAEVDTQRCRADGVDWVRRPTGGRAILHTDELTYSVVLSQDDPRAFGGVVESYRHLSRGLMAGLALLRLNAAQAVPQRRPAEKSEMSAACFDLPSHYEVTVESRKLVGSAQTRRLGVVLQHGTLPLVGDITRLIHYLRLSDEEKAALRVKLLEHATTLEAVLGRPIGFDEAAQAMAAGFSAALRLELVAGDLTPQEEQWTAELRAERFGNAAWTEQR
jgi:lipoate-protein ligase A